ncbi:MAG: hypothetical protein MAG795_01269 [Candidatus Woesearchaeota archaeon]|nr:hypothetical protein [Candidatus Woesearchaeota archaeon]
MSIENVQKEILSLRKDIDYIKSVISEDFELSSKAKKRLKHARQTPESEYIDL